MKRCRTCDVEKAISEFYRNAARRDGRLADCKPCFEKHRRAVDPLLLIRAALGTRRRDSRRKAIPFSITLADILPIPVVCPVLGLRLKHGASGGEDASPSIDRVIPHLGYVPGNVIVVSLKANRIKNDATPEELMTVAKFYAKRAAS